MFVAGDWLPDTAARAADQRPGDGWIGPFSEVLRSAAGDAVEVQDVFWTSLFEEDPQRGDWHFHPLPELGPTMELLYDYGHLAALGAGIRCVTNPAMDEIVDILTFLDDPGVAAALDAMADRTPCSLWPANRPGHRTTPTGQGEE